MITSTITCDICGAKKGQTNHWFEARVSRADERGKPLGYVQISPLTRYVESTSSHLCGIECATKFLARELAK